MFFVRTQLWLAIRELWTKLLGHLISAHPFRAGMDDPVVVWLPSIGVTGMTLHRGRFPHWRHNLFVGGLREGGIPGTGQINALSSTSVGKNYGANRC